MLAKRKAEYNGARYFQYRGALTGTVYESLAFRTSLPPRPSDSTVGVLSPGLSEERITQTPDGSMLLMAEDASSRDMETVASPVITDLSPVLGETFPVPAKLRTILSDDVSQRFEWRYYLRREGKGRQKQIMQVGRKMKVSHRDIAFGSGERQSLPSLGKLVYSWL